MTSKSHVLEAQRNGTARMDAVLRDCLAEMGRARKRMKMDQVEINRLKAETRAMLAKIKAS